MGGQERGTKRRKKGGRADRRAKMEDGRDNYGRGWRIGKKRS